MNRIVCAALRLGDQIIAGPRHYDRIMHQQIAERIEWARAEQGFLDQRGTFYNRWEAWLIADFAHQIINYLPDCDGTLYSEHLY